MVKGIALITGHHDFYQYDDYGAETINRWHLVKDEIFEIYLPDHYKIKQLVELGKIKILDESL